MLKKLEPNSFKTETAFPVHNAFRINPLVLLALHKPTLLRRHRFMPVRAVVTAAEQLGMWAGAVVALLMGTAAATVTVTVVDIVSAMDGDIRMQLPLLL